MKTRLLTLVLFFCLASVAHAQTYTPTAYGAVGDGVADDTAAVQSMITAMPDYAEAEFYSGQRFRLTAPLVIQDREGLRFIGHSGQGSAASEAHNNPYFVWDGAAGATMLNINRSRGLIVYGLGFIAAHNTHRAGRAINIDQWPYANKITSDILIERCSIWNSSTDNADFIGIRIAEFSHQNCEFIRVRDCFIFCSQNSTGTGIEIGPSYNAKSIEVCGTEINYGAKGIYLLLGSLLAYNNKHVGNAVDYWLENSTEPVTIQDAVSESARFLYTGVSDATVKLQGNKWEGPLPAGKAAIEYGPSGSLLIVEHNFFGGVAGGQMYKPGPNAQLYSQNNTYSCSQADLHLGDFPGNYGVIVNNDIYREGGSRDLLLRYRSIGAIDNSGVARQMLGYNYDYWSSDDGKVMLSRDGANIVAGGTLEVGLGYRVAVKTITANTLLTTHDHMVFVDAASGGFTITLPVATNYLPQYGARSPVYILKRLDATNNIVDVRDLQSGPVMVLSTGQSVTLVTDGVRWRVVGN